MTKAKLNLWEQAFVKVARWSIGRAKAFGRFLDEVEEESKKEEKKHRKKGAKP